MQTVWSLVSGLVQQCLRAPDAGPGALVDMETVWSLASGFAGARQCLRAPDAGPGALVDMATTL